MRLRSVLLGLSLLATTTVTAQTPRMVRPPAPPARTDTAPLPEERATMRPPSVGRRSAASAPRAAAACTTGACALPLLDTSALVDAGAFTFDWSDGAGGDFSYGGQALAVSENGAELLVSCLVNQNGIGRLRLPSPLIGGRATPIAGCAGPNLAELRKLHTDPSATVPQIGGVLEVGGRVVVTGFISYDASGGTLASHWAGPSLSQLAGPFAGTVSPGLVKSSMGIVPPEWRAQLGGPAFSTAGYTSIISRASYGAAFSVFDPAAVTANGFAMRMLLGCPHAQMSCRTWTAWGPSTDGFEGAELGGHAFIVSGTRTLVVIEREASGWVPPGGSVRMEGYGLGTRNPAEHGAPIIDNGVQKRLIYSLSDPLYQGNKGYEYRLVAKLYDLAELVDVRDGLKQPWDVKQYATVQLPGSRVDAFLNSVAYNHVTRELYLLEGVGAGLQRLRVIRGWTAAASTTPPAPTGSLTCTPSAIVVGDTTTCQWTADAAATSASIAGVGVVTPTAGGSVALQPTTSTTYVLTLAGAGGTTSYSAPVTVTPPAEVCGDGIDNDQDGLVDENCAVDCVEAPGAWGPGSAAENGWSPWTWGGGAVETRFRERTWLQTTAAAFGGAACAWTTGGVGASAVERQTDSRPYSPPPPPTFGGIVRAQTTYTAGGVVAGMRVALQVPDVDVPAVPALNAPASLLAPMPDGTTDRRACTVYRIEPTGYTTVGARTRVTLQCPGLTGVRVIVEAGQ